MGHLITIIVLTSVFLASSGIYLFYRGWRRYSPPITSHIKIFPSPIKKTLIEKVPSPTSTPSQENADIEISYARYFGMFQVSMVVTQGSIGETAEPTIFPFDFNAGIGEWHGQKNLPRLIEEPFYTDITNARRDLIAKKEKAYKSKLWKIVFSDTSDIGASCYSKYLQLISEIRRIQYGGKPLYKDERYHLDADLYKTRDFIQDKSNKFGFLFMILNLSPSSHGVKDVVINYKYIPGYFGRSFSVKERQIEQARFGQVHIESLQENQQCMILLSVYRKSDKDESTAKNYISPIVFPINIEYTADGKSKTGQIKDSRGEGLGQKPFELGWSD